MGRTIYGEGPKDAKIYIYGEAPGQQEEFQGRPFVGGAGKILDGLLQETGIERSKCYIDNVIQERPPGNNFNVHYKDKSRREPTEYLVGRWTQLRKEVAQRRPNVVIALGEEAMRALTGKRHITKWRGSLIGCEGVKVIPIIHPAAVMRQWEFRPMCIFDLTRAKAHALTPTFPPPRNDRFIINPTYDEIFMYIEMLKRKEYISFDIETDRKQIMCMGLGWSKSSAVCIPIFYGTSSWWNASQEKAIILALKDLFANTKIKFIAQNAQYDMVYMKDLWGIEVKNLWMDTMIAQHCVYPELPKGLAFLCSVYTDRPYYKGMSSSGSSPETLWTYNCLDAVTTWEVAMALEKEMEEFGTSQFYWNHSHKLIKPLMEMQRMGVRIDIGKRVKIDENLQKDLTDMGARLEKAVGHPLNPASPKQMKEFLYGELKLPQMVNRKTGTVTANEDALKELSKKYPNPIFDLVLDIRKVNKLLSTYIRAPLDKDERIRCSYVITGTDTGRLSSRESVYGSGTNLQNIPRDNLIRSIFIPDEGKEFVNADLSQAEARVVAYIAKDARMQALFEQGGDVHTRNAATIFSKPSGKVTSEERQLAKALVHAANYGVGPRTFAKHVGTSPARAGELLNQYFAFYPNIKRWHIEVEDTLRRTRLLETPFGRKRHFIGRWGPDLVRKGLAFIPQSTVSDCLNLGIINAWPNLPPDWNIVMQVHDSVLIQLPIGTPMEWVWKFIKHYFEFPIRLNGTFMAIPVDIKRGPNWAELKEVEVK